MLKLIGSKIWQHRADIEFISGITLVSAGTSMLFERAGAISDAQYNHLIRKDNLKYDDFESNKEYIDYILRDIKLTTKDYAKAAGIPIAMEAAGLILMGVSNATLEDQAATATALAAGYAATINKLKTNITNEYGENKYDELLYGLQSKVVTIDENGTVTEKTEYFNLGDNGGFPPHSFMFDESRDYEGDNKADRDYLEDHLRWINEKLWASDFLWENDILRDLHMPLTKSGWTSGIMAVDENGNRNYISYGLEKSINRRFIEGIENVPIIILNVEDNIIDKLHLRIA